MTESPHDSEDHIQRWAVRIEYDGRNYIGWQRQQNGISIQQLIEEAATSLTRGRPVSTVTSGRTDAGVHASCMVAHLDFPEDIILSARTIREALNFHLRPHPVVVLEAAPVSLDWNARFSACWRRYRYTILNRPARPALQEGLVWHVRHPLDHIAMQKGANYLLGRHDFTSFRASACQAKNPLRTLDELTVLREGDYILVEAQARAFLHHQVRNMVGTICLVGSGKWPAERVLAALEARDRSKAGPTAPADGLCFINVGYEQNPFG